MAEARSWKLIPHWVKETDLEKWKSYSTWNARDDELEKKPSWKGPFKSQRCLLVLEGFYEKKFLFTNSNPEEMVVVAGLYEDWDNRAGRQIHSCTMVTTVPNELIKDLHPRMPAILGPEAWDAWLSPDTPKEELLGLLRPAPVDWLQIA